MESRTTHAFRSAFSGLPEDIQAQARRSYELFRVNPAHPSLRFKKVDSSEDIYSIRIGLGYLLLVYSKVQYSRGSGSAPMPTMTASFERDGCRFCKEGEDPRPRHKSRS